MHNAKRNVVKTTKNTIKKHSIVILSAGIGYRMRTYGAKCLLKIHGEPIALRQIRMLRETYPDSEIIYVVGFQARKVISRLPSDICVVVNPEYETANVAYSIYLGMLAATNPNIMLVYGDVVFNEQALNVNYGGKTGTLLIDHKYNTSKHPIGCVYNKHVEQFIYDQPATWSQITYLNEKAAKATLSYVSREENKTKFGFEALNHITTKGFKIIPHIPDDAIAIDVDTYKNIEFAEGLIK